LKLSDYAKQNSVTYKTAYKHWKKGLIRGKILPTGTIVVFDDYDSPDYSNKVILYARVSSSENKSNLESQLKKLQDYSSAKGYIIVKEYKEIGSGINDKRKMLEDILKKDDYSKIVVEHKDRLTRFGYNYIATLLNKTGKVIEVINETNSKNEDLMQDFISIITSFCARIYGLHRCKRKTEKIIKELKK